MSEKKYEFTGETREVDDQVVRQIRATCSFGAVGAGELGGWVTNEASLSQRGRCWVHPGAVVLGNARVSEEARVSSHAVVRDNARVTDRAVVTGRAVVSDWAVVGGDAYVGGGARVSWQAHVNGKSTVGGSAQVTGTAQVLGDSSVNDDAVVTRNAVVRGGAVREDATVSEPDEIIVINGLFPATVTVYRANGRPDGHLVTAGCQRFSLTRDAGWLQQLADVNGWELPPGWRQLRQGLLTVVRAWQREAGGQVAD